MFLVYLNILIIRTLQQRQREYLMYVYKITNLINKKVYIGQSRRLVSKSKAYYGSGYAIKSAIKKYGKKNFFKEILCECETQDELNVEEKFYINKFNSTNNKLG